MSRPPGDHEYRALRDIAAGEEPPDWLNDAVTHSIAAGHIDRETRALTDAGGRRLARLSESYGPPDYTACDHEPVDRPHDHRFLLRRGTDSKPPQAVLWAVWTGGFREIRTWPWTVAGLAEAQAWCDANGAIWEHSGYPVHPGSLAIHASTP